ncbi:FCS-Like Zinc finger 6-like [Andrographis paniculata]|uniref:FCS-Like Zinc finger 6-like n=1 Tax=Andrographis paniculata TaxID=175694 RepID=UPI0021E758FB|nr:FCS-Like Zinc finger 6-like [Andrographis paniculata]
MMLGKRSRPPVKRTTSMTEFTLDFTGTAEGVYPPSSDLLSPNPRPRPRPSRRNSADFVETAHFLTVCALCQRRLIPGHDIYIYRGDSAFCSLECRQQQMSQDEKKDKCSLASKSSSSTATGETVAAV